MDAEYIGIPKCVSHWSVLLASRTDSTLLGSFMNWAQIQHGGKLASLGDTAETKSLLSEAMHKLREEGNVCAPTLLESLNLNFTHVSYRPLLGIQKKPSQVCPLIGTYMKYVLIYIGTAFTGKMLTVLDDLGAKYDDSKPFEEYLQCYGMTEALKETHCIRRAKHFIVPHVCLNSLSQRTTWVKSRLAAVCQAWRPVKCFASLPQQRILVLERTFLA